MSTQKVLVESGSEPRFGLDLGALRLFLKCKCVFLRLWGCDGGVRRTLYRSNLAVIEIERKLMMWNTLSPVFIIFIGFYSIRHSGNCQGGPRRITVKVVLDVPSF